MSERELLPCPFCGGNDVAISVDENQGNKWGSAVCFSCSAVGPEVRTGYETYPEASWRAEAAAEWNRRSPSRQSILEEAAKVAERGCLVPPDGGSPTEAEREMCEAIAAAIRSLSQPENAG
jgi:Lar family restriction alleviation protein